jgi:hypothetical protein
MRLDNDNMENQKLQTFWSELYETRYMDNIPDKGTSNKGKKYSAGHQHPPNTTLLTL